MNAPIVSWTPVEAWVFAEMARRALVVSRDGKRPERASLTKERAPVFAEVHAKADAIVLSIRINADRATIALDPVVMDGNRWRPDWALEIVRGDERWILSPGDAPITITGAKKSALAGELRVKRRAIVRAPCDGAADEIVALVDAAFHKYTKQSSALDRATLGFAAPTTDELAPWWELDLGKTVYLGSLRIDLGAVPRDAKVTIEAYPFVSPTNLPPTGCASHTFAGPGPFVFPDEVIARFVRVSLDRGSLAVHGVEALGGDILAGTLRETLRRSFALHRDRTLFEARDGDAGPYRAVMSYADVWARSQELANALAIRIEPRSRDRDRIHVILALPNGPDWVIADLAAIERGYVVVPVAPDDPDDRLASIFERVRPDVIFCEPRHEKRFAAIAPDATFVIAGQTWREPERAPPPAPRAESDLYTVLFTSGSTGAPKGAMRSYETFLAMLVSYGSAQRQRHLSFQPLSHMSERMFLPCLMIHGATIAFSRGGAHLIEELRAFEPTQVGSVPRLYDVLYATYRRRVRALATASPAIALAVHEKTALAEARASFGPRVNVVSVGSAPVTPEVLAFLRRCFADLWVFEGYGTTEVGTIAVDGKIAPHVEVKLVPVDPSPLHPLAPRGEIWVRSPHVISGYLGEDSKPAALDDGGWFATGDLGERDADGTVRVVGRLRNTVKLGQGEFVSAERIEAALASAPDVDRIFVHAVAGGAGIAALVFVTSDVDLTKMLASVRGHGQRAGLAAWELPRGVVLEREAATAENGLLTTSGKLARATIAKVYGARLDELASGDAAPPSLSPTDADDLDLAARLTRIAGRVLRRPVDRAEPLGTVGLDSLAAAEILAVAGEELGRPIPLALWFESATLADLADRLAPSPSLRSSPRFASGGAHANAALATTDLAMPVRIRPATPHVPPRSVLVTGATGLLGAHLVESLVARTSLAITCLVRGDDDATATKRLHEVFAAYEIPLPPPDRLRVVAGDLAAPRLDALADVDMVLHSAAEVSWLASYEKLRAPNVLGTIALLELGKPMHFVSTISTAPADGDEDSVLPFASLVSGSPYGLTKWIAEEHVRRAGKAGLPVAIYRPAMIAAHTTRGHGNPDDFVHRYLVGVAELGLYLDLEDVRLDMTPVDFVADAIVALVIDAPLGGATHHLVNVDQSLTYAALGRALVGAGVAAKPATYTQFRDALLAARASRLFPLASYFPASGFAMGMGPWPCPRSIATVERLGVHRPRIDDAIIGRVVRSLARRSLVHVEPAEGDTPG